MLLGYGSGGELGAGRRPAPADDVVASEYLTMEERRRPRAAISRSGSRTSSAATTRSAALLPHRGGPRRRTRTSRGRIRTPQQRRAACELGQPREPHARQRAPQLRCGPEPGDLAEADARVLDRIAEAFAEVGAHIEGARFRSAIAEAMRASTLANQYLAEHAPWALVKTDRVRAARCCMSRCAASIRSDAARPFLPFTSQAVHELLGYDGWLAGPLEFQTSARRRPVARGPDRRLRELDRLVAAERAARRPGAARAATALQKASAGDGRRRARAARPVIDTHTHLDALDDDPADVVARARRRA